LIGHLNLLDTDIILVVDNDALVRLGTLAMLRDMGVDPLVADGAQSALEQVAEHGLPHILVTDYAMPGGSGITLARQLTAANPVMRVLIVTGHDQINDPVDSGWIILQKPFTRDELAEALETLSPSS
jgi:DNA-binding NtrC family response regulator